MDNNWTKVDDQPPDSTDYCWTYSPDFGFSIAYYTKDIWVSVLQGESALTNVTHWSPMHWPELPRKDKNGR